MELSASAPGKLLLLGEYAVTRRRPAIGAALSRRLTCRATARSGRGRLSLQSGAHACALRLGESEAAEAPPELRFMAAAAMVAARSLDLRDVDVAIESASDFDRGAVKTGIGGSAAVTAATVAAVYGLAGAGGGAHDLERRLRIGVLAHRLAQGGGSSADVVLATAGGLVAIEGLEASDRPRTIDDAVRRATAAPSLRVRPLALPPGLALEIGWTGRACRSGPRADHFARRAGEESEDPLLSSWMEGSRTACAAFATGCARGDAAEVLAALDAGGRLLERLAAIVGIPIWTAELRRARRAAASVGGAAKPSGAGGGDCAIAIVPAERRLALRAAWAEVGIEPLSLEVEPQGARVEGRS